MLWAGSLMPLQPLELSDSPILLQAVVSRLITFLLAHRAHKEKSEPRMCFNNQKSPSLQIITQ